MSHGDPLLGIMFVVSIFILAIFAQLFPEKNENPSQSEMGKDEDQLENGTK